MPIYTIQTPYISGIVEFSVMRLVNSWPSHTWRTKCWHQDTLGL